MNTLLDLRDAPRSQDPVPTAPRERRRAAGVLDDISAAGWVQAFDAAWLGRDWKRIEHYLGPDVEFVPQGGSDVIVGRDAVLAYLRQGLDGAVVHEYNATDLHGRVVRSIGIVTYRWQLDRTTDGVRATDEGRDMLALRAVGADWQLAWRIQHRF